MVFCDFSLAVRSNLDALIARSPSDEFIFSVPRDPFLSPYWADDQLLNKFPPVRILVSIYENLVRN
jgi:hormone-sensitive lipase